jgi:group I intron endonuclease
MIKQKYTRKLLGKSEIYMITNNITGKKYIGQTKCYYNNKKRFEYYGSEKRFKSHCVDAKNNIQGRGARCLINSIRKYGKGNHSIKPLFICDESKANYFETKFIRQYKTIVPNGMNIMKGGKACSLAEETKKKLSESKKGRYTGSDNPNYGKKTSEEAKQKMREKLTGVPLKESVKENMRKSHKNRKDKGILPPRRKHSDLPKYIYHVINKQYEGYEVRNHTSLKNRKFCSMKLTMEEKLEQAIKYITEKEASSSTN